MDKTRRATFLCIHKNRMCIAKNSWESTVWPSLHLQQLTAKNLKLQELQLNKLPDPPLLVEMDMVNSHKNNLY